ncbi:hypothetical protein [Paradesulfitobacterium ferrireducens]|uniref:hypothetical protein n=1 Tax=Paradesulfitobacterium ferrireducens TaxID=2816476 RepID=UPI001A8FD797|nr:hypothetical protein [Paradesulfitobacterium ferrireducens]
MRQAGVREVILYVGRVFLLLLLLAVLLPKLAGIANTWLGSVGRDEEKPSGNPMRVEKLPLSEFVLHLFTGNER